MSSVSAFQSWFRENASRFSGQLLFDEPLSKHTYYRMGGPAPLVAIPKSMEDLQWLAEGLKTTGAPLFVLGAGSNLLVADSGYSGVVVKTGRLNQEIFSTDMPAAQTTATLMLRTGGSVMISTLLRRAAQEGWGGLEFLTGIPGTVGGVVFMNGGTHLGEAKDRLRRVEVFPLLGASAGESYQTTAYEGDALKFQYRKNLFLPQGCVVWSAHWEIRRDEPARVKSIIDEILARRKSTQPIDYPSCGSVFKNPRESGMSAWQVVDKLGLRGYRIGDAQFAEKHSNFILNLDKAKASDVRALIALAKERAQKELGVQLEEEVIYLE